MRFPEVEGGEPACSRDIARMHDDYTDRPNPGGRLTVALVLGAALALVLAWVLLPRVLKKMPDFEVYWRAGTRVLAGEPLYRPEDGHFQHKYLPVFALLMIPWSLLPLKAAKLIWFSGCVAALFGLVMMSVDLLPSRKLPRLTLAIVTTAVMAKFFSHELVLGQCNALMALCILVALRFLQRDRPVLAGAFFGLSAAIKPYALLFLPYLLLKRQFVTFGVFLAFAIIDLLLPAAIYGVSGNARQLHDWIRTLDQSTPANLLNQDNVSLWAMYAKWVGPGWLAFNLALGTIGAIAVIFLMLLRKGSSVNGPEYLEVAVLLALLPLLSPQGWDYGLLVATPAVVLIINESGHLPLNVRLVSGTALAVLALSLFDLMGRRAYASFMSVSSITVCALMALSSVAYIRLNRMA